MVLEFNQIKIQKCDSFKVNVPQKYKVLSKIQISFCSEVQLIRGILRLVLTCYCDFLCGEVKEETINFAHFASDVTF